MVWWKYSWTSDGVVDGLEWMLEGAGDIRDMCDKVEKIKKGNKTTLMGNNLKKSFFNP